MKVISKKGGEDPESIQKPPQKLAKKRLMEPAPEVKVVKTGDKHCNSCDQMFSSTFALERHVKRYHMGEYNNIYKKCSKKFMSKESFDIHAKSHVDESPQFPCEECNKVMHSRRAYNKHMRV